MDVRLPVYLYDVMTTDDPPRLVVSCKSEAGAQDIAQRLNQVPREPVETFNVVGPRLTSVLMAVEPGSSVLVREFEVASEVLAEALSQLPPAEPAPVEAAPAPAEDPAP